MRISRVAGVMLVCGVALIVSGRAEAQRRGGGGPACTTVACDVQGDWERTRTLKLGVVNAMPDDKFGFKPTPAQGSFAERAIHVAQIDVALLGTVGGKTPAPMINAK